MPAELLRDVTRSSEPIPARRLSMLPVSMATHVAAAIGFVIITLSADVDLPPPMPPAVGDYMAARPVPSPPPQAPVPRGTQTGVARTAGAPIAAPPTIGEERERPSVVVPPTGLEVSGGLGSAAGYPGGFGSTIAVEPPPPPPAGTQAVTPVRPGRGIREPKKIVDVTPVYPALARAGQIQGVVILEAVINVRGEVERLRVIRSAPLLDEAAIEAVRRWRYTPTLLNGVPVPVLLTITVHFTLR